MNENSVWNTNYFKSICMPFMASLQVYTPMCQKDSIQCKGEYPETGSLKVTAEQNPTNTFPFLILQC